MKWVVPHDLPKTTTCMSQRANHNSVNRSDPPGRQTQPWRIGEELGRCDQQRSGERAIFEPRAWIWATNGRRMRHLSRHISSSLIMAYYCRCREQGRFIPKNTHWQHQSHDVSCVFQPSHKRVHEMTCPFRHVQHSLEVSDPESTHIQ